MVEIGKCQMPKGNKSNKANGWKKNDTFSERARLWNGATKSNANNSVGCKRSSYIWIIKVNSRNENQVTGVYSQPLCSTFDGTYDYSITETMRK